MFDYIDEDQTAELLAEAMEDAKPTSTGIPQLDSLLGGGLHKGLTVVAGNPSSGKTALAVQLALYHANQQDGNVTYDMADMGGRRSALLRMISCSAAVAGVEGCRLSQAGMWDEREQHEGLRAYDIVTKGRVRLAETRDVGDLLIDPHDTKECELLLREIRVTESRPGMSNSEREDTIMDLYHELDELTQPAGFVVLDFAQSMTFDGRPLAFDAEAASLAARELRTWAHDNEAVVLLLSAYSKSAAEAHARGAVPQMSDVLGSAELAYSAEHVLALDNPHDGSGRVTVRDLKHRHGDGRPCALHLDADHGLFS